MLVRNGVSVNVFPVPSKQSTSLLGAWHSPLLFFFPEFDGSADIFGWSAGGGGGDGSGWWPNKVEGRQWAVSGG